jgi:hypothetical protein
MVLFLMSGVLFVLSFLCISNFVISSLSIQSEARKPIDLEQKTLRDRAVASIHVRHVNSGVIKAIGIVFGERPTRRKVTEPTAVALKTSRVGRGDARLIRTRFPHSTSFSSSRETLGRRPNE